MRSSDLKRWTRLQSLAPTSLHRPLIGLSKKSNEHGHGMYIMMYTNFKSHWQWSWALPTFPTLSMDHDLHINSESMIRVHALTFASPSPPISFMLQWSRNITATPHLSVPRHPVAQLEHLHYVDFWCNIVRVKNSRWGRVICTKYSQASTTQRRQWN